jgi:hypothetical protein
VANVDKGFEHYIKHFRKEIPVTASIRIEKGHHGEYGWGVYVGQGRHRCILAGMVANRPEEETWGDTLWTACAELASLEPILGQSLRHVERPWTPDEFKHIFEGGTFDQEFVSASECRKKQMERVYAHFCGWNSEVRADI